MSSFVELTTKEVDNICLALAHATRGNQNPEAVKQFDELIEKLLPYASSTTSTSVKIMKMI